MKILFFKSCSGVSDAVPTRLVIAVMMFTACMMSYMLRVNMSINILDMVKPTMKNNTQMVTSECIKMNHMTPMNSSDDGHVDVHKVSTLEDKAQDHVRYEWSSSVQGLILGSYFWGYIATSLPGGLVAERWGPRAVIGWSSALSGVLSLLSPFAADMHHSALLACRVLTGALGGVLYPSLHSLVANWAPPEEKGKFIGALMGGTFGTVLTWSLCGVLISMAGWRWAFFIPGLIMISWSVLWFFFVADTPQDHPRINEKEKNYIADCIGESVQKKKPSPPFKDIFCSLPFWAFTFLHFGNLWGLYFLLTAGPKFMTQVLGFNISQAGYLASLPYMSRMLMAFLFGSIGDAIRKRKVMSVTATRKFFCIFSHFIPGLLLVALTFVGCDPTLSVIIITASLGVNGAATITNLQNHQDLAPNFAGSLYGLANCIGSTTGFITPLITGYFTKERNGLAEWRYIFFIGASAYFICGLIFIICGTGETQSWNNNKKEPKETKEAKFTDIGLK